MGLSHILWHIPERLIHLYVRFFSALLRKVPSYGAKRVAYFFLYLPYIANYVLTFFMLRHTNASVCRAKTRLPVIHVSGPFFSRKKDDIILGDMIKGVERKFHFCVIGEKPSVSSHDTPAVRLDVGKVRQVNGNISSFTVSMMPKEEAGSTSVSVSIKSGGERDITFRARSTRAAGKVRKASITRLKGGARFAFSWRLDWDHATSPAHLGRFFSFVEKWGIPPTIYVSGAVLDDRLYGDFLKRSAGKYVLKDARNGLFGYGTLPGADEMRKSKKLLGKCAFSGEIEFPIAGFSAEIGNHMFHHFGGPESILEFNPRDGKLLEDDLKRNHELIKKTLGTVPRTWSRPAGGEYPMTFIATLRRHGYDSVCNFRYRMGPFNSPRLSLRQFGGITELSSNYPRDPYFSSDVAVLESALECCNHSSGTGSHMVLSSHLGPPFVINTIEVLERLFSKALESSSWLCTVSSFVTYATSVSKLSAQPGEGGVTIKNPTGATLERVPVEIAYGDGSVDMITVDCPARKNVELKI